MQVECLTLKPDIAVNKLHKRLIEIPPNTAHSIRYSNQLIPTELISKLYDMGCIPKLMPHTISPGQINRKIAARNQSNGVKYW